MPELPEVETTRLGILPHVKQQKILQVKVHQPQLRWSIPQTLSEDLPGKVINTVQRRGKYLLFDVSESKQPAYVLIHLGMSGSLRIAQVDEARRKHDHVEIMLSQQRVLRYHDPRRFGCVLWSTQDPQQHPLLAKLGVEPLTREFNAKYLYQCARRRSMALKPFIMQSSVVVGVGNIYAAEALFLAGLDPRRAAKQVTLEEYQRLVQAIKKVLRAAIRQGGTTLRDFISAKGEPGYFQQRLNVYGRAQQACKVCATPLCSVTQAQRSTVFCPQCQG
jgi:formamidopyrimidine-DNA glycosylase